MFLSVFQLIANQIQKDYYYYRFEINADSIFPAVRNVTGHYYLNGNWRIDFPRKLRFAGTIFHYERKPHVFYAPESLMALGPTTEPIYISVSGRKFK